MQKAIHKLILTTSCLFSLLCSSFIEANAAHSTNSTAAVTGGVAAVVNDEVITINDVENRLKYVLLTSNMDASARSQILPLVVKSLIDEKIRLHTALKYKIKIDAKAVAAERQQFLQMINMPEEQFIQLLNQHHIDPVTVDNQMRAHLAWRELIQLYCRGAISVNEREIDQALAHHRKSKDHFQYLLSEIVLRFNTPAQEKAALSNANELLKKLQQGVPFQVLAQQFSEAQTASNGGDRGWVTDKVLDAKLVGLLSTMKVGQFQGPVLTKNAVHIIALRDQKGGQQLETYISAQQSIIPVESSSSIPLQIAAIKKRAQQAHSCPAFIEAFKSLDNVTMDEIKHVALSRLPDNLHAIFAKAQPNTIIGPLISNEKIVTFMVCERGDKEANEPTREELERLLYSDKMNIVASRMMREAYSEAVIEVRM